jgi:hypothetical protein
MEQQISNQKRPDFLTVLCILSFVGVGIVAFSSIINFLLNLNSTSNSIFHGSEFDTVVNEPNMMYLFHMKKILLIVKLISALICLGGVLLMWNLKKIGYFIYTIAEISPTVVFTILFWNITINPFSSFIYWINSFVMAIAAVAFIIMYSTQLKHMS